MATKAQRPIKEEDITMLKYFWEEKGDMTRYCDYEEIKEDLDKNYPEISKAYKDYIASKAVYKSIMSNLYFKD